MSKRIAKYHQFVDRLQTLLKAHSAAQGKPVTCARGCAACCYEPVYVHEKEARHAFEHTPESQLDQVKARAAVWVSQVLPLLAAKGSADVSVLDYRKLRVPCPFLHDHQCLVYDHRPTACRLHLALGPKAHCDQDDLRLQQQYASSPEGMTLVGIAALEACKGKLETDHLGAFVHQFAMGQPCATVDRMSKQIDAEHLEAAAKKRTEVDDLASVHRAATDKIFKLTKPIESSAVQTAP